MYFIHFTFYRFLNSIVYRFFKFVIYAFQPFGCKVNSINKTIYLSISMAANERVNQTKELVSHKCRELLSRKGCFGF